MHTALADRLPRGVWRVDPDSSQINFRARTLFVLPVNGFFERFSGALEVHADGTTTGSVVVATATIRTGIAPRDQHLRSAEFFNVAQHPEMTFTIKSLAPGDGGLELEGTLQIRDRSLPLRFPLTAIEHDEHLHLEARIRIDYAAAGLRWARPGIVGPTARADVALTLRPAE